MKVGKEFDASAPKPLFQGPSNARCRFDPYAVTGDGQSFLMIEADPQAPMSEPMHVILHWDAELRR